MLFVYLMVAAAYVAVERDRIREAVQRLQQLSRHEKALVLAEAAVSAVRNDARTAAGAAPSPAVLASVAEAIAALEEFDPAYVLVARGLARGQSGPGESASTARLYDALARAADELEIRRRMLGETRDELSAAYQRHFDAVTAETLGFALFGLALFGAGMAWFLGTLTGDIRRLEAHARRIVHGARGENLQVRRDDELGRLMHAVNRLSADLDQREKQIELESQRRSHQDKMLAVGALAAGVAHEVNNPLAVIAGVAQDLGAAEGSVPAPRVAEAAQLIIEQARRASMASRHLAEAAAPQASDLDWVDVNTMVTRVLQLMHYDRRYRAIEFASELDGELPALRAPASALQQVLMQMATLGCDATCAAQGRTARVRTCRGEGVVEVLLEFPARLDFTRPEVQRTLLLSRALVEPLGARLAFRQAHGPALHIKLAWPAETGKA